MSPYALTTERQYQQHIPTSAVFWRWSLIGCLGSPTYVLISGFCVRWWSEYAFQKPASSEQLFHGCGFEYLPAKYLKCFHGRGSTRLFVMPDLLWTAWSEGSLASIPLPRGRLLPKVVISLWFFWKSHLRATLSCDLWRPHFRFDFSAPSDFRCIPKI